MAGIEFRVDTSSIALLEAAMKAAAERAPDAVSRAINWTGDRAKTRVARTLAKQTGLLYRTTEKALRRGLTRSTPSTLAYVMRVKGGNVSLKYFNPKEGRGGVTARPWGKATFYEGAFITSGLPGRREPSDKLGGHVYRNVAGGKWRGKIAKVRSGLYIPDEATKGEAAAIFQATVEALLPGRVGHEVGAILSGFAP